MKKGTTADRLKRLMTEKGLRQIDIYNKAQPLCKKYNTKLGRNDLSQYLSGKVEPGQSKIALLAEVLNVNPVWLMGLDVPMYDQKEFLFGSELENLFKKLSNELNMPLENLKNVFINYESNENKEPISLNYDNLYNFFLDYFKIQEKYKQILKNKGLMDEDGNINEKNFDKLMTLADTMKDFNKKE